MCFVPVDFCTSDCIIGEPNLGNALHFAPSPATVDSAQATQFADAHTDSDRSLLGNFSDNLELHASQVIATSSIMRLFLFPRVSDAESSELVSSALFRARARNAQRHHQ